MERRLRFFAAICSTKEDHHKMEKSGYIYVLTNESFCRDNWIKIGYAEDVDRSFILA